MSTHAFDCQVCGGKVDVELVLCASDWLSLVFKCRRCGRWQTVDATDALDDAREYFEDELRRVEGAR